MNRNRDPLHPHPLLSRLGFDEYRQVAAMLDNQDLRTLNFARHKFYDALLLWLRDGRLNGEQLTVVLVHLVKNLLGEMGEVLSATYIHPYHSDRAEVSIIISPKVNEEPDDTLQSLATKYRARLEDVKEEIRRIPLESSVAWTDNMTFQVRFFLGTLCQDDNDYYDVNIQTNQGQLMANRLYSFLIPSS